MKTCVGILAQAILAAGVVSLMAVPVRAQTNTGTLVTVIDIATVFKSHARLQQGLAAIKQDVTNFENQIKQEREEIVKKQNLLSSYQPNSPEYRELEKQIAQGVSGLQVRAQLKRKDVLEREAKEYLVAYNDVLRIIDGLANKHGISLVLRMDSQEMDANNPGSIMRGVNRSVIYQNKLDLTQLVINQVKGPEVAGANRPRQQ